MRRLILYTLLILGASCALFKPQVVVVPADREIKPYDGHPGYYIISGGQLKDLYDQQRILTEKLEECKIMAPAPPAH